MDDERRTEEKEVAQEEYEEEAKIVFAQSGTIEPSIGTNLWPHDRYKLKKYGTQIRRPSSFVSSQVYQKWICKLSGLQFRCT